MFAPASTEATRSQGRGWDVLRDNEIFVSTTLAMREYKHGDRLRVVDSRKWILSRTHRWICNLILGVWSVDRVAKIQKSNFRAAEVKTRTGISRENWLGKLGMFERTRETEYEFDHAYSSNTRFIWNMKGTKLYFRASEFHRNFVQDI